MLQYTENGELLPSYNQENYLHGNKISYTDYVNYL